MACDYLLYVSAHISPLEAEQAKTPQSVFAHWRSAEAWYRDDPSDPRRWVVSTGIDQDKDQSLEESLETSREGEGQFCEGAGCI